MIEGVPPYSESAESAVLGAVFLNPSVWPVVYATLNEEDFYLQKNKVVFKHMLDLAAEGVPIDHITLGNALLTSGSLDKIGGAITLDGYTESIATTVNTEHYANIVRDKAAIRGVIYAAHRVASGGMSDNGSEFLASEVDKLLTAADAMNRTRMPDSLLDMGARVLSNYELVESGYRGISLPWPSMDAMTAGLWPKTITMFVARPGTGKSFIAVICARHAWLSGKRVLVVSPEMSKDEIAERFFVIQAGVDYHNVVIGQLPTPMRSKFVKTIEDVKGQEGLYIMDSDDDLTPKNMEAAIRACKPDLVAIDSIYDIKVKGDRKDRVLLALEWIKKSAKTFGFAAVGFAQQNRSAELTEKKGGGARLGTIALADEIGQDSHGVFALEQTRDDKADKIMKIKPLKLRRGQFKKPTIRINWDFEVMRFDEIEDEDEEELDEIPF